MISKIRVDDPDWTCDEITGTLLKWVDPHEELENGRCLCCSFEIQKISRLRFLLSKDHQPP